VVHGILLELRYVANVVLLCDTMWIGVISVLILSYFLVFEIMLVYYSNPVAIKKKRKEIEVKSESRLYGTRALTLAGLTFAGIIFLVGSYNKIYEDTLLVMAFSFGLLLLSYNFEILTGDKELYFIIQDRLLACGFLGLMIAISVFFWNILKIISFITFVFIVILGVLHLMEVKIILEIYKNMEM